MNKAKVILDKWVAAVSAYDVDLILSLYDADARLLPTYSDVIRNTPETIKDYFMGLARFDNVEVILDGGYSEQHISEDIYVLSGDYRWELSEGENMTVKNARYSFVIDTTLEAPITHHHSSEVPGR